MTLLAAKFRIKHRGIFNLKGLYEYLHEWVIEEGYAYDGSDPKFRETFHSQTEFADGSKELWIWWRCEKNPAQSSYYKYELDIDWHAVPFKDIEMAYKGKKLKLVDGELEIQIYARVVSDCNDTWKKHWFLKHFNRIYWKVIMKSDFEKHKIELYRDAYRLQETIKDYWKLIVGAEEPEHEGGFLPQEGIGE